MKCPSCGKEIEGNLKFCSSCGTSLQNHFCTTCGSQLNTEQKFCMKCGTPNPHYASNVNKATGGGFPVYSQTTAPVQTQPAAAAQQPQLATIQSQPAASVQQPQAAAPIPNQPEVPVQSQSTAPVHPEPEAPLQRHPEAPTQNQVPSSNGAKEKSTITIEKPSNEEQEAKITYESEGTGKGNGAGKLILVLFLLLILGGGGTLLGEYLGWWDIQALSWAKSEAQKEKENIEAQMQNEKMLAGMMESGERQKEEAVEAYEEVADEPEDAEVGRQPYSVTLPGLIGGKYRVEMMLEGYTNADGFYPESGKYRYTKYEGAWIALNIEVESVSSQVSRLKIKEYSDGNLTGTWDVIYDLRDNFLGGNMRNAKGELYDVRMGTAILSDGYHKITGDVVTDTKRFPFYIDFQYDNGKVTDAEYHNPNYSATIKLTDVMLSANSFYFIGSSNGEKFEIRFSPIAPYEGTMDDGTRVQKIEMNM